MAPSLDVNCKYYWWHTCVLLAKFLGSTCACLLVIAQLISHSAATRPSIYATMNSISPEIEGLSWKWEETHESRRTVPASVGKGIRMTCVSSSPHEDVMWRKRVTPEQNYSAAWLDMASLCTVVQDPVNILDDYTQSEPNREGHGREREHCTIITVSYTSKGKGKRNTTLAIHNISEDDFATYSCGPSEVRGSELGKDDLHAFVLLNDKNGLLRNYVEIEGRLKRSSKDSHSPWHIYTEEKLGKHNNNDSSDGKIIIAPFKARSQTAIEGMSAEILCDISEPPAASKNEKLWSKLNLTSGESNHLEHTEEGRYNSSWNGTKFALVINSVKLEDRGIYNCSVFVGGQMVATSGILLRVKSKMAPLWPFITICVEVVVLSIIILVYEKSKKKDKIEESDTDGSPDHKNVSENNDSSEASRLQKET